MSEKYEVPTNVKILKTNFKYAKESQFELKYELSQ